MFIGDRAEVSWVIGGALACVGVLVIAWGMFRDRSRGRRRCPRCWYDMSGVPGLICPECGRTHMSERRLLRARPSRRVICLGLLLLLVAGGTVLAPAAYTGKW